MFNSIVTITDQQGNITVSSRSIALLIPTNYNDISSQFTNWIKIRANRLVLEEGKDYTINRVHKNERGFKVTDYLLTLDAAIKLAKSERAMDLAAYLTNIKELALLNDVSETIKESPATPDEVQQAVKDGLENASTNVVVSDVPTPIIEQHIKPKSKAEQLLELAQSLAEEENKPRAVDSVTEERIQAMELKLNTLTNLFESAAKVLFPTLFNVPTAFSGEVSATEISEQIDATEPLHDIHALEGNGPDDPTTERGKLHQLVNAYAASEKKSHRSIWSWLYQQLRRYYNFNVSLERKSKTETYLDAADRGGQVPALLYIAQQTLIPTKSEPAQSSN